MHPRKYKQEQNKKKNNSIEDRFANDPAGSKCPYCDKSKRPCSYIDGLSRAWARAACKKKQGR